MVTNSTSKYAYLRNKRLQAALRSLYLEGWSIVHAAGRPNSVCVYFLVNDHSGRHMRLSLNDGVLVYQSASGRVIKSERL